MGLVILDPEFRERQMEQDKPRWQQAAELADAGVSARKIATILDCDLRNVYALLGTAAVVRSREVKRMRSFAEWMCEPYTDETVRDWMRREVEAWEARREAREGR